MMRYATLCSGIEGFGLGFDEAGMKCVFQCEQDKDCLKVLGRHYANVERTTDVNDPRTEEYLRRLRPGLIAFGSPCQDLSVAGRREGLAGERSGLFFRCVELCFACEAEWVVWENVPGVFSSQQGEDFASVLESFTGYRPSVPPNGWRDTGVCVGELYSVAWAVLDAQWFGVPQRRRRVFLVASLGKRSGPYEILSLAESMPWNSAPSREAGQGVAASLSAGSANSSGVNKPGRRREDDVNLAIAATLNSGGNAGGFRTEPGEHLITTFGDVAGPLNCSAPAARQRCDSSDNQHLVGVNNFGIQDVGNCISTKSERYDGDSQTFVFQADDYHEGTFEDADLSRPLTTSADRSRAAPVIAIMSNESHSSGENVDVSPTLRVGSGIDIPAVPIIASPITAGYSKGVAVNDGKKGSPQNLIKSRSGIRRLTPCECERLQGFPDCWTQFDADGKEISDSARYRMCGNAVNVAVSRWIGNQFKKFLGDQK